MSTYGIYTGQAINFFNLPQTLITALAVSVLPTIASARAAGNHAKVSKTLGTTLRMTVIITLPAGAGFIMLAGPILRMLYSQGTELGGVLMGLLGFAVPAAALVAVTNSTLQAIFIVQRVLNGALSAAPGTMPDKLITLACIGVAVAVYAVLLLALGAVERDDVLLLPKGEKIADILHLK